MNLIPYILIIFHFYSCCHLSVLANPIFRDLFTDPHREPNYVHDYDGYGYSHHHQNQHTSHQGHGRGRTSADKGGKERYKEICRVINGIGSCY